MAPRAPTKRKVRFHDPMLHGYTFVPAGNVYITANCRRRTRAAKKELQVVINKDNKVIGLRCPVEIHEEVLTLNQETAESRAEAVRKRDGAVESQFIEALLKIFPKTPQQEIPKIIKQTLKKRAGRVGRTSKISLEEKVALAVRAHLRHNHTDYEQLLRAGTQRGKARKEVFPEINRLAKKWRGSLGPLSTKPKSKVQEKSAGMNAKGSTRPNVSKKARGERQESLEVMKATGEKQKTTKRKKRHGKRGMGAVPARSSRLRLTRAQACADGSADLVMLDVFKDDEEYESADMEDSYVFEEDDDEDSDWD